MSETRDQAQSIFLNALDIETDRDRAVYVEKQCGADVELRREVEDLLEHAKQLGGFLEPDDEASITFRQDTTEMPGDNIGPYKLLQQIGDGGFGVVYLAEQTGPVRREVALKVIKPGMDTRQVVARFEAERQALALMDHPNIARVFDAGATGSGRPYFAMELIRGVPITDYCDQCQLTTGERLELFTVVCQGVQHAHQKGIIHRDIKPTNVLVAMQDGRPIPKIIDFGVAKAINQRLTENAVQTGFAQMLGTPLYMSPEQAEMSPLEVDTRSDIYSLGVLLYELLTGTTPFAKERLSQASFDELRRIIREEEPPHPSCRMSTLQSADLSTLAERRRTRPKKLERMLRGELDWLTVKCLEKDRNRRYQSSSALAADVERYLADEPVEACPPSVWYRFLKFARRRRVALVMTAGCLLTLAVLVAGVGWSIHDHAVQRQAVEREVDTALADAERLLNEGQPRAALSVARRAVGSTDRWQGGSELRSRAEQWVRDVQMVLTLEDVRLRQATIEGGRHRFAPVNALPLYRGAFQEYGLALDQADPQQIAADIRRRPAAVRIALLSGIFDYVNVVRIVNRIGIDPHDGRITFLEPHGPAATAGLKVGDRLVGVGARDDGERVRSEVTDWSSVRMPPGKRGTEYTLRFVPEGATQSRSVTITRGIDWRRLVSVLRAADDDSWRAEFWDVVDGEDNEALLRLAKPDDDSAQRPENTYLLSRFLQPSSAVELLRRSQQQYPGDFWLNHELALRLTHQKPPALDEAIGFYRAAVALRPDSCMAHTNLGLALAKCDRWVDAVVEYRRAIHLEPNSWIPRNNLGRALEGQGRVAEAITEYRRTIELSPHEDLPHTNLGEALRKQGELNEAVKAHRRALELNPDNDLAHTNLGAALSDLGKPIEAIKSQRRAIELNPENDLAHTRLGNVLSRTGKLTEAIEAHHKAIELDPTNYRAYANLGSTLTLQGKLAEAIEALHKALELKPHYPVAHTNLGSALGRQGKLAEAIEAHRKAIESDPEFAHAYANLGAILATAGKYEEAITELRKSIQLDPDCAEAWLNLGGAFSKTGQSKAAVGALEEAIRLAPSNANAYYALGMVRKSQGRLREAIDAYRAAIDLKSDHIDSYLGLGLALSAMDRHRDAAANYRSALKLDPDHIGVNLNLGHCLTVLREYQQAIAAYRQVIELDPRRASAHNNLSVLLASQGEIEQAISVARRAIELDPAKASAHANLGRALLLQGDVEQAIAAYQKAIELAPDIVGFYFNLGQAFERLGRTNAAIEQYKMAMRRAPNDRDKRRIAEMIRKMIEKKSSTRENPE